MFLNLFFIGQSNVKFFMHTYIHILKQQKERIFCGNLYQYDYKNLPGSVFVDFFLCFIGTEIGWEVTIQ